MTNQERIFNSMTITPEFAAQMISDQIHEAYNRHGDNDHLVASEIIYLYDLENATANASPTNLAVVEDILLSAGGARRHQCMFQFRMKIGS